jgi:hypothetical protein
MPAKRRLAKERQLTELEEAKLWSEYFCHGADYFDDLAGLGHRHRYDTAMVAAEAWRRLGPIFLSEVLPTLNRPPALMTWALSHFGRPWLAHGSAFDVKKSP